MPRIDDRKKEYDVLGIPITSSEGKKMVKNSVNKSYFVLNIIDYFRLDGYIPSFTFLSFSHALKLSLNREKYHFINQSTYVNLYEKK